MYKKQYCVFFLAALLVIGGFQLGSRTMSVEAQDMAIKKIAKEKDQGDDAQYAANGGIGETMEPVSAKTESLSVSTIKNYVFIGNTRKIRTKVSPAEASKNLVYSSSNTKYAVVTSKGVIKPKKAGYGKTVTITVKASDNSKITKSVAIRIIDRDKPMVALTFDDGPSGDKTQQLVKTLKQNDARATFFVLGRQLGIASNQAALKAAYEAGNEIGSHTYNHKQLTKLPLASLQAEIRDTSTKVEKIIGAKPTVMRAPYGAVNDTVKNNAHTPIVLWNVDTLDWKTLNTNSTINSVMNHVKDGDIILMHDIHSPTISAAQSIIPQLIQKGYQLVTVSELAEYKGAVMKDGGVYYNFH